MKHPRVNRPKKQAPVTSNTTTPPAMINKPAERPKLRAIFKSIGRGLIDAVPFVGPIINGVNQQDETQPGQPNWPRIVSSIVSGIIALLVAWAILTKNLPIETAKEILDLVQVF